MPKKPLTEIGLKRKIRALGDISEEEKAGVACVLVGHSNVVDLCFGYVTCARCGEQIGDMLSGTKALPNTVIIGHKERGTEKPCRGCKTNYGKLDWTDLMFLPEKKHKEMLEGLGLEPRRGEESARQQEEEMSEEETRKPEDKPVPQGAFFDSLRRNNQKIRADRAEAITEDAQTIYRRAIEDLELKIRRMQRERENMLDLSPTHAQSLVLATDFDAAAFVEKDVKLGVDIRNDSIRLEIAKKQYVELFGEVR